jgi:UDP-N-acetylglucosamine--N-acetylmuramyl-(pentapeptide) pyrophosphoryl-undecaprenol N-acetylglucosamine transferase
MTTPSRAARLIFAGGGTGGHLYPAIAIADRISALLVDKAGAEILFIGTKRGIEYRVRDSIAYPLELINVRGLARSFTPTNLLVPFLLVGALLKARSIIEDFKPDIVVGTGGYVSLPVLKAASTKRVTTVIQEQNSFPGIATRKSAGQAARVYLGFAGAEKLLTTTGKIEVTGNPVRPTITSGDREEALRHFKLDPDKTTVLVIGGSQGARSINQAVLKSLMAGGLTDGHQLLWQTGKRDYRDVIAQAGERATSHALFPFENRMELVYAAADLAIARAGALTLAELQACAVPAILVPYPQAAGDHQTKNARQFAESGFARIVMQTDLAETDLLKQAELLCDSGRCRAMHEKMKQANAEKRPAVDVIAEDIITLLENSPQRQEDAVES